MAGNTLGETIITAYLEIAGRYHHLIMIIISQQQRLDVNHLNITLHAVFYYFFFFKVDLILLSYYFRCSKPGLQFISIIYSDNIRNVQDFDDSSIVFTELFIDIYTFYFTNFKELPVPPASQLKLISVSME